MKRLRAVVSENGNVSVIEEVATVLTEDDLVIDSVSYDIIGNEEFTEQFEIEYERRLQQLPTWVYKLVKRFSN